MKALLTRKLGMTSLLQENGLAVGVTLLATEPNTITQLKTSQTDGYNAIQLGFETNKKTGKAQAGHLKASKVSPKIMREFRINEDELPNLSIGDQIGADTFEV